MSSESWLNERGDQIADGDWAGAETLARARHAAAADDVDAQAVLAAIDRRRGKTDAARKVLERLVEADPEHAFAHAELAAALDAAGDAEGALDHSLLARAFTPVGSAAATAAIVEARLLARTGEVPGALGVLDGASGAPAVNAELLYEKAGLLARMERADEAAAAYRMLVQRLPLHAAAWGNLALVYLNQLGDPAQAAQCCRQALAVEPGLVAARGNLALALAELGRDEEAFSQLDALVSAHPEVAEYRWNRGILRLGRGDYARGWDDYEARNRRAQGAAPRQFPFPEWDGEPLGEGGLLVYGEQGLGDEIMFASCMPDVLGKTATLVIECHERLSALFARSFPQAHVHASRRDGDRSWLTAHGGLVRQVSIASLPRLFRRSREAFPARAAYLRADARAAADWRSRLPAGRGRRIGLAWRGGTARTRGGLRTLPACARDHLLGIDGMCWVSLQHDANPAELDAFDAAAPAAGSTNLDTLATAVAALDLVITVDSTLAHLAGALGCPVWILLPHRADWRWGTGTKTPWYPSARLFRQHAPRDWNSVVDEVVRILGAEVA